MDEVSKIRAAEQVNAALRTRNGPRTEETVDLALGLDVLVWRIHKKKWTGPYKLLAVEGETATIQLPHGPANFRTTTVKRYDEPKQQDQLDNPQPDEDEPTARRNPARTRQVPARYRESTLSIHLTDAPRPDFTASRQKELDGLIQKGVFELTTIDQIPTHARLFNSRFVDDIKLVGTPKAYEKSCLVVQVYNDSGKKTILT